MQNPDSCVFCNRSKFADQIIAETEEFYVMASLGQITDGGYVLIVPKHHCQCLVELRPGSFDRFLMLMSFVIDGVEKSYGILPTFFEHGNVGQSIPHAHLHVVPARLNFYPEIRRDFPIAEIDRLRAIASFYINYKRAQLPVNYLLWGNSDNDSYACWEPQAPKQYLRTLTAKLLGRPERADWRKMDPELDKKLCEETIQRLKPYFQKPTPP